MSALWPVQQAVYAKLAGDAELMALISGVWDEPPEKAELPYLAFGELTETPMDTHDSRGFEVIVVLNAWSDAKGNRQPAEIIAHVDRILHRQPLTVQGWEVISIAKKTDGVRKLPGERTPTIRQGQTRFRVWVTQPL